MYINHNYGFLNGLEGLGATTNWNGVLQQTVPANPAQPYVQVFAGDNFDGPSAVILDGGTGTLPVTWYDKIQSMIVNGDWTFLAHVSRNSKRAKNPDVISQLSNGRYNAAALRQQGLYKTITYVKLISAPVVATVAANEAPAVSPAPTITSQTTPQPSAAPVQQFMPQMQTAISPAPTLPPTSAPSPTGFLANVDWVKWSAIAVVAGTLYTIVLSQKGKRHVA